MSRGAAILRGLILACLAAGVGYLVGGFSVAARPRPAREGEARAAFLMEKAFYDEAFAQAGPVACPEGARGAVVNHHLLAKAFVAEALGCADPDASVAVLIAPNHFAAGSGDVLLSAADWTTPYGTLEADRGLIAALERDGAAAVDEAPFAREHGVGNLVAFVKRAMPRARIVPVILRDDADDADVDRLAAALVRRLPDDAFVIGSFDFSHELAPAAARHADARSLDVLRALDVARARRLDVDSAPGLRALMATMRGVGAGRFTLQHRSDSSEIVASTQDDVTSYLTGTYSPGEPEAPSVATYLFLGDVMLDRDVRTRVDRHGLLGVLGGARRLLLGSDGTVANFEGAASERPSPPTDPERHVFTVDAASLGALRAAGFTHFSLANNHADDAGEGVAASRALLEGAGFATFGDLGNGERLSHVETLGGLRVAFVGHHAFRPGLERVIAEVRRLDAEGDIVIVMPHWGEEYRATPTVAQREAAKRLVEAGADLIIGAHPHVIQPYEEIDGRPVFWSLGNFLFDQLPPDTRVSLAVGARFEPGRMSFSLIPVETDGRRLKLVPQARRDTILKKLGVTSEEFSVSIASYGNAPEKP